MTTVGLDIGGTKIECQVFDDTWGLIARQRIATPPDYAALLAAVAGQVAWAEAEAGTASAVGIGTAGLEHPVTGRMLAANLATDGQTFRADLRHGLGRDVAVLNDCRALALSEAVFGAGRGRPRVMGVILGTGVSGGMVVSGALAEGPSGTGGEIGHMAAPAHLIATHGLPVTACGCGRMGCVEGYVSASGLVGLARHLTGEELSTHQIAARKGGDMARVWALWCALVGEMLHSVTVTLDPDVVVLGGGLSLIEGAAADIQAATQAAQFAGFPAPAVVQAQGGDTSGARGAAYAAWRAAHG